MKLGRIFHDVFEFGIFIKLINGIWELAGGTILFFVSLERITSLIQGIFQHELSQEPSDIISNIAIGFSNHFSAKTKLFASFYLLIHGVINIFLFASLSSKKLWAYPVAGFILIIMILFETARFLKTHSLILLFLIIVDLAIIALMRSEYERTFRMSRKRQSA